MTEVNIRKLKRGILYLCAKKYVQCGTHMSTLAVWLTLMFDVWLQSKAGKSECSRHTNVPTVIMQHLHGKDMALAKDWLVYLENRVKIIFRLVYLHRTTQTDSKDDSCQFMNPRCCLISHLLHIVEPVSATGSAWRSFTNLRLNQLKFVWCKS